MSSVKVTTTGSKNSVMTVMKAMMKVKKRPMNEGHESMEREEE